MTPQQFAHLRQLLKDCTGITLGEERQDLLESRLRRLLREHELDSVPALCEALSRSDGESLRWRLAETLAVQESYFFRDKAVFATFADVVLPALLQARAHTRRLRIWCAAASTGQEPYSIAMLLAEREAELKGWDIDILATDFSEDALLRARNGIYTQFEVQRGLPVTLLVKYFRQNEKGWEISPAIRSKIDFRQQNLLHNSMRHGRFDVIFCRNVMIYFDDETKRAVLGRLTQQISDGGYLVLGATETVSGSSDSFSWLEKPCPGVYRLNTPGVSPEAIPRPQSASAASADRMRFAG